MSGLKDSKIKRHVALELNIDDLAYRGEGNANLVVSLKSLGKVIRLSKIVNGQENDLKDIESKLLNESEFNWNVMCNLFKPGIWINKCSLVKLSKNELIEIKNKIEGSRPDYRKSKSLPSVDYLGLLIDDYCRFETAQLDLVKQNHSDYQLMGSVYSVEIKPKQGFISEELAGLEICRFRLKQEDKLSASLINKASSYCPLDLFSGDKERMRFALNSLFDNPQNNFRFFVDQEQRKLTDNIDENMRTFENNGLDKEKLIDFLIYAFNHSFNQNNNSDTSRKHDYRKCKYHQNLHGLKSSDKQLNSNSILKSILDVQRLDEIGLVNANNFYTTLKTEYTTSYKEWINEWNNSKGLLNISTNDVNELDYLKHNLNRFLYSMTAKDCSIMVTFQRVLNVDLPVMCSEQSNCDRYDLHKKRLCFYKDQEHAYLFSLALVDLDRKNPAKIQSTNNDVQKRASQFKF